VPHFNYVGESILGRGVHFGAGVIASNYKNGGTEVSVWWNGAKVATGRNKLGVLAGDGADVGAQAVLNPGTILGRGAVVYPLISLRGTVPPETIAKTADPAGWVTRH
jgi:acetyltransferase-like isoleucine patch superfamily enzyme